VRTCVTGIAESGGWAVDVSAAQPAEVSPITLSEWVERGRDGVDLPLAGLVAESVAYAPDRLTPWLEMDGGTAAGGLFSARPVAWLVRVPRAPLVGAGLQIGTLEGAWQLDIGWRSLCIGPAEEAGPRGVAGGTRLAIVQAREGTTSPWPEGVAGTAAEPVLVLVVGGGSLDARGLGDLYAVLVVDGGGVRLEGTRVHGAVCASGTVDLGGDGQVLFAPRSVRWAADRSLVRTRVVPGSRRETIE
jgi:hypothetical protein